MNETDILAPPVTTLTRRSRRIPVIWSIPLLAIAIGAWLAWDTYTKRGPTIMVAFTSAEGLTPGQSQLKFKDIVFGTVESLELAPDQRRVVAKIATTSRARPLLTDQTVFWVAKPRLFAGSISGLETLVSGSYVAMLPGAAGGHPQRDFVGHEDPPILTADMPGRSFVLHASRLGSISLGSPVFFRDLPVGQVLGWDMAEDANSFTIRAFVRAPYDQYVHEETRFWDASGLSVKLGSSGIELQLESLRALLLGGLAFDTPATLKSAVAQQGRVFPLFPDHEAADAASYQRKVPLLAYFAGSVRGLGVGSEVTMHGLKVGRVTNVRLDYDLAKDVVLAPVQFEMDPERVLGVGNKAFATPREGIEAMVKAGWRASLESASLITGQQVVTLDIVPDAPPATVTIKDGHFVVPTIESGGLTSLTSSATDLLKRVDQIPFKQIGSSLDDILRAANVMMTGPEMKHSLTDLAGLLSRAQALVGHLDTDAGPAFHQLPQIATGFQKTLTALDTLAVSVDRGYGNNTKFSRDVERLLAQLNDALRSMRSLTDLLARHPEALIHGRSNGGAE